MDTVLWMQNTREGSTLGKGQSGPLVKEVVPAEEMRDPTEATSTVVQPWPSGGHGDFLGFKCGNSI